MMQEEVGRNDVTRRHLFPFERVEQIAGRCLDTPVQRPEGLAGCAVHNIRLIEQDDSDIPPLRRQQRSHPEHEDTISGSEVEDGARRAPFVECGQCSRHDARL
jgi:hypothetical protein